MISRVIKREEPKEATFKTLVQDFYRENPKIDIATICIYEGKPKRSDAQSRLYFSWRDIFADELGETKLKMHEILKKKFNVESTKDLNVMEFVDFLCEIDMLADEHSMKLPYGNDYEIAVNGKIE
jgi:hypothetical protein|tara:strand:+ start:300 stop:674 length:375 start_codon:yes stop_codon:yes gene_type:complete